MKQRQPDTCAPTTQPQQACLEKREATGTVCHQQEIHLEPLEQESATSSVAYVETNASPTRLYEYDADGYEDKAAGESTEMSEAANNLNANNQQLHLASLEHEADDRPWGCGVVEHQEQPPVVVGSRLRFYRLAKQLREEKSKNSWNGASILPFDRSQVVVLTSQ